MNKDMNLDIWSEKLEALESRNAFQDDIIDKLNQELTIHQQEIAELKYQLKLIASRLKEAGNNEPDSQDIEPPPPHY
ncbi:MAG: SlyX family protein [Thalassotalea sp.]